MTDLEVVFVLNHKDDMVRLGIIPEDVKWDELTEEQENNVKKYLEKLIEGRKEQWKC